MEYRLDDYLDKLDRDHAEQERVAEDEEFVRYCEEDLRPDDDPGEPGPWDDLPAWEKQRFEMLIGRER